MLISFIYGKLRISGGGEKKFLGGSNTSDCIKGGTDFIENTGMEEPLGKGLFATLLGARLFGVEGEEKLCC